MATKTMSPGGQGDAGWARTGFCEFVSTPRVLGDRSAAPSAARYTPAPTQAALSLHGLAIVSLGGVDPICGLGSIYTIVQSRRFCL